MSSAVSSPSPRSPRSSISSISSFSTSRSRSGRLASQSDRGESPCSAVSVASSSSPYQSSSSSIKAEPNEWHRKVDDRTAQCDKVVSSHPRARTAPSSKSTTTTTTAFRATNNLQTPDVRTPAGAPAAPAKSFKTQMPDTPTSPFCFGKPASNDGASAALPFSFGQTPSIDTSSAQKTTFVSGSQTAGVRSIPITSSSTVTSTASSSFAAPSAYPFGPNDGETTATYLTAATSRVFATSFSSSAEHAATPRISPRAAQPATSQTAPVSEGSAPTRSSAPPNSFTRSSSGTTAQNTARATSISLKPKKEEILHQPLVPSSGKRKENLRQSLYVSSHQARECTKVQKVIPLSLEKQAIPSSTSGFEPKKKGRPRPKFDATDSTDVYVNPKPQKPVATNPENIPPCANGTFHIWHCGRANGYWRRYTCQLCGVEVEENKVQGFWKTYRLPCGSSLDY